MLRIFTFCLLTMSLLNGFALAATKICQVYLLAENPIAILQEAIDELKVERNEIQASKLTLAEVQEIGNHLQIDPATEIDRKNSYLKYFYLDRLKASIRNLENERNWLRAQNAVEQIIKSHPEVSINAEVAVLRTKLLFDQGVVEQISLEQIKALDKIMSIRATIGHLAMELDRLPRSWSRSGDYTEAIAQQTIKLLSQIATLKEEINLLIEENFPKALFEENRILALLPSAERFMELQRCCGGSCGSCPIQRNYGRVSPSHSSQMSLSHTPQLLLFQLAPYFDGLIPTSFDPGTHNRQVNARNTREKNLLRGMSGIASQKK